MLLPIQFPREFKTNDAIDYFRILTFKQNSTLPDYLLHKEPYLHKNIRHVTTLHEVVNLLHRIIIREGRFHKRNTILILCGQRLTAVLNTPACLVSELVELVRAHLKPVDSQPPSSASSTLDITDDNNGNDVITETVQFRRLHRTVLTPRPLSTTRQGLPRVNIRTVWRRVKQAFGPNHEDNLTFPPKPLPKWCSFVTPTSLVETTPKFLNLLHTLTNEAAHKRVYEFRQIVQVLRLYILTHRSTLVDRRNIHVIFCRNTLLGQAFRVPAFHRTQLTYFVLTQCTTLHLPPPRTIAPLRQRTPEPLQQADEINPVRLRPRPTVYSPSRRRRYRRHPTPPDDPRPAPTFGRIGMPQPDHPNAVPVIRVASDDG